MRIFFMLLLAGLITACNKPSHAEKKLFIAAASDLNPVMDSLAIIFMGDYPGTNVTVSYGSSGKLYQQIINGAPFDIFFSADESFPQKLYDEGIGTNPQQYAMGNLVMWTRKENPEKEGLKILLRPSIRKISIANPHLAPYGSRAEECLKNAGIWNSISEKIVMGENISQAAQFLSTGAADAGIISLSYVNSPEIQKLGGYNFIIPDSLYRPLKQNFVILKRTREKDVAGKFADFIHSNPASAYFQRRGFRMPE